MVIEVCQGLIGQTNEPAVLNDLQGVLRLAWQKEPPALPQPASGGFLNRLLPGWKSRPGP
jgi:hypothetical protein